MRDNEQMHKYVSAVHRIRPDAEFILSETYESLTWLDKTQVKPTLTEFNDAVAAWEAAKLAKLAGYPMQELRQKRDGILESSDWRDLPSYAGLKQAEWRVYRQALRDITAGLDTVEKVKAVTWPEEPEEPE
jgi:hypothetical protein